MNSHFNRQFLLLDFRLLDDPRFLKFAGTSAFSTYLVLRRHVWRSPEPHHMGLHDYYQLERKLVSSLDQRKIARLTGLARQNTSANITSLENQDIIRTVRTGRQNIYVLGEWLDVYGDGSYRGVEWFYLEGLFGIAKADVTKARHQVSHAETEQMSRGHDTINREENRENNTVSNGVVLKQLPDLDQPEEKTRYVAQHILAQLGDDHSERFYQLAAAKVPEAEIRRALAEIKVDGARDPARVFTYRMKRYALQKLKMASGEAPGKSGR